MALLLEVENPAGHSSFLLTPFNNRRIGRKRQLTHDAQRRACRTVLRTWDGVNVLPGAVVDGYENADGNPVPRGELVATEGAMLFSSSMRIKLGTYCCARVKISRNTCSLPPSH